MRISIKLNIHFLEHKGSEYKNNYIFEAPLKFSLRDWKPSKTKLAEEYFWAIKQAVGGGGIDHPEADHFLLFRSLDFNWTPFFIHIYAPFRLAFLGTLAPSKSGSACRTCGSPDYFHQRSHHLNRMLPFCCI